MHTLTESRRYQDSPEIGVLATALNRGVVPDMSENKKVLRHHLPTEKPWNPPWLDPIVQQFRQWHKTLENGDAPTALAQQKQFQILCALREGPQGVNGINTMIEKALQHKAENWYIGKPVMITANHPERKLFNGDVGIVLPVEGMLKACFQMDGQLKMISQVHMPPYETCYAITIHKSQGSEYTRVLVVLPADEMEAKNNPVLTRELVYTAVTRAKDTIDLWCGKGVLEAVAAKTLQRMSGLGIFMGESA
jgi:exodeoxyribonuclease V alpha subunit